ncbi:MAG: bifunctional aspartate kinase/homoserine dehydrogenase I [Wenzhouxiangellaceae bacterium]|nr:bifunctional aspartate kinase/homoserine dehydrogenase I [Wenzhouxiangellaceae bacterium]
MNWVVHKFGGSSVADAEAIAHVGRLLLQLADPQQAVVVSAMRGTTDALIDLAETAARPDGDWHSEFSALHRRHIECAEALGGDAALISALDESFDQLRFLLQGLKLLGSVPVEALDLISGLGETWSAQLLCSWFQRHGEPAVYVDAREVIGIERGELGPIVLNEASRARLQALLGDTPPARIVMTGFCCRDASGRITTLGRNGSDFSATILAALLDAELVQIWTDVAGVLSADPNRVPQAQTTEHLSYLEAFELAYFGARVLHPQTMAPVLERGIPVRIRSTRQPEHPGTLIDAIGSPTPPVKGVSSIENLALVNIEGAGMLGVPGTAERVFSTLNRAGISVTMISQGSSEHSICCVLPRAQADRARRELERTFSREIDSAQLQRISVLDGIEVLAVVGDGMAGTPGVAGRVFSSLGRAGVNVRAIAQGSSERNISVAVDSSQITRALRAVHSAFYLSDQTLSIGLVGPGQVGRALLSQIAEARTRLLTEQRIDLRVRALANSSRMQLALHELPEDALSGRFNDSAEALDYARFAEHVHAEHLPHAAIIDCTASNAVADHYAAWLADGIHVITPNKQAGSGDLARYRQLRRLAGTGRTRWRYEATVGAGLPVIQTLRDLVDTGDRVLAIEGIFSGTLAWLFNRYQPGMSFAALVREAREAGYTEPDPRDDLSGMDVARKLVILAREAGMGLTLDDVEVESLMHDGAEQGTVDEFLESLEQLDGAMQARVQAAADGGRRLRYVGRLDCDGNATVGVQEVDGDHPFAHLALTDNVVAFRTERYSENPLIVQGPGAGPAVTAAGIFSDLLRIAQQLN